MQTKTQATQPLLSGTPADLPGPLPALQMLNQVARSLGYVEGPRSPFLAVIEGVRTLLHADGVAVLVRDPSGEYRFHAAQGGLEEWRDYTLSAPG